MQNILNFILTNFSAISLILAFLASALLIWLSRSFVTRKEFNQQCKDAFDKNKEREEQEQKQKEQHKEEHVIIETKLSAIFKAQDRQTLILRDMPKQKDLHNIEKILEKIQGDNKANSEKMNSLQGDIRSLGTQVDMVFDHLLNNKASG